MTSKHNLKNCFATETDSDIENKLLFITGEGGGDNLGVWDLQIHTTVYKIDKQQGFTVQHRELYSISCNNIMEKNLKSCTYMYIYETEPPYCMPETDKYCKSSILQSLKLYIFKKILF